MTRLTDLGVTDLRDGIAKGDFSAKEVAESFLTATNEAEKLNAFITLTPDHALKQAEKADKDRASGQLKPLSGVPLGIKDLFCTNGYRTTAASKIIDNFVPPYESTITEKLFSAGAGMVGKLNLDQFAMGSSNETSAFGNVISPWRQKGDDTALTPGGSSGGSAAAVAAKLVPAATGTDTGGSIRQPASFTGITGLKPTYGRCSRYGVIAFASSLDQAGPMAHSVKDCAALLEVMAGFDPKDSTSVDVMVPNWEKLLSSDIRGKKIGIPKEYRVDGMAPEIESLWQRGIDMMKDAGAEIIDVSLPHTQHALAAYYIIAPAEASSNLARYDGVRYGERKTPEGGNLADMYAATRAAGFGDEVKRRIMIGTYVLSAGFYDAYYIKAQKIRALIARDFEAAFDKCDILLTPATPTAAFALGQKQEDPIAMYLNDVFTVPASLAGLPAMTVPVGLNEQGLPLGLQLIGKPLDEQSVLNAGLALEERAGFTSQPKKWW
ncbi:glutamyl-tRNA(Gln) amidotransferase A subunit [Zymomonas mobilis subsp. mobilis ZM4 = ATCC 31821]|uniref:Glutamyl-tRNA(Gln) amidotransferase subunit A n=2 Tax=Zymomonas mobilis subsp. mobilis TaxID=120045 RepID=GATA_ZYMMO|nr:Asp-tRNA(Asn)/Glu-tRNA(Gln) amidotransferase subunit GatA [Zymomonas mobilis]Q5NPF3.1 RecName: Full=Glutamyl-tRNA(Gln) amidotransferase subunit A; Short=Glu-ADT subunit A [Zymomonas mobilis subsp. mobilis ZM4 = ATCC 31821]AAV89407.1 glutamyl-tRNA(Gln) amidotransferase, A subunit [Zymomonas mobilis subsp. mobilis ZM4 = ATCC 31821]ACV75048.1 glutamyl-tRNA(Gln) amidotransferase, A subunit [Zymomonas mobilis subsp. mobilis NCIMB 11163]AEH62354.1 glutamyl-tRNA(Gln) amidotransferase, A subunit [Zy